eukprot:c14861_g1_i2.p2 GENE.c14861_g1_i2~~c14861_g1_i2.p2  ORF type:complete len:155 (-),score=35.98 c14861_g1_i2:48-512(-)
MITSLSLPRQATISLSVESVWLRIRWMDALMTAISCIPGKTEETPPLPIKQGELMKRGGFNKGWKKRFFVLEFNVLRYYVDQRSFIQNKQPQGGFIFDKGWKVTESDQDFGREYGHLFHVGPDPKTDRVYILAARSKEERAAWITAIGNAINLT